MGPIVPGTKNRAMRPSKLSSAPIPPRTSGRAGSASAHRPRGRYAYVLTRATRIDVERLAWPHGRPDRPPDLPSSPPIHELATLDLAELRVVFEQPVEVAFELHFLLG